MFAGCMIEVASEYLLYILLNVRTYTHIHYLNYDTRNTSQAIYTSEKKIGSSSVQSVHVVRKAAFIEKTIDCGRFV